METGVLKQSDLIKSDYLTGKLESLIRKMELAIEDRLSEIDLLHPDQRISAVNLLQYLALRSEDVRSLQDDLHVAGLSSLASSESHILRQMQEILQRLGKKIPDQQVSDCDYFKGRNLIDSRAKHLFGTKRNDKIPYLMVTFDTDFADRFQLVKKLLEAGMNVARINCAHDGPEVWHNMIEILHAASEKTGLPCKVYMDLGGPKMRTVILGRGRSDKKVTISENSDLILAEKDADYDPSEIVIGCDEPGLIKQVKKGERILFDDGVIETEVSSNSGGIAILKVKRISKKPQLKAKKGINFPDSELSLSPLTESDRHALPFICEHADLIGYSFVRTANDLKELLAILSGFSKRPEIILKIETAEAVQNFPALLMQGMMDSVFGVMIARGDLAVEIGFERMSEIQEEILWISEAAHVPVIWATQVLETLNKYGIATRSEITDAAYAAHSECVMINKGDYVINVMNTLSDILRRSGGHHAKKRYTFRPMQIASNYLRR